MCIIYKTGVKFPFRIIYNDELITNPNRICLQLPFIAINKRNIDCFMYNKYGT